MSGGINKVILVGHLGRDPEVKYMASGDAVANLAVATSESWKDKQGQQQEKTEWHRVSIFGKVAEIAGEYLKKGSMVYLEGQLQTRKWQDKDGNEKFTTEVVLKQYSGKLQMLGNKGSSSSNDQGSRPEPQTSQQSGYNNQQPNPRAQKPEPDFDFDDDIPF
tara:strand:+ start:3517 stop:4002 length:486 start_codon:yes stop_codon:yes gene_type:complete